MTSSTTGAHPGPRCTPGAGCAAASRRRGVERALSYLLTTVLASVFTACGRAQPGEREPALLQAAGIPEPIIDRCDQIAGRLRPGRRRAR